MQGALHSHPEMIITAPFWDNFDILRNNKVVKETDFPAWATRIKTVNEFFYPGTLRPLTKEEWLQKYGVRVYDEDIIEIQYVLRSSFRKLGLHDGNLLAPQLPFRPLLIELANLSPSGCGIYNKLLKQKSDARNNLTGREHLWHEELECTLKGPNSGHKFFDILGNRVPLTHVYIQNFDF